MKDPQQQGRHANINGRLAEHVIADTLTRRGVAFERQHWMGKSIYRTDLTVDFFIPRCKPFPDGLVIESKWQQISGSADEKLPYLVHNIRDRLPCPAIIVIDGGGMRPGALDWLKSQVDHYHLFAVFSLTEFLTWCNQAL